MPGSGGRARPSFDGTTRRRRPTLLTWRPPTRTTAELSPGPMSFGMRPLVAHCHLGLGKLYRRAGDDTKAREHLTTAATMYREMGMTFWLEKARRRK